MAKQRARRHDLLSTSVLTAAYRPIDNCNNKTNCSLLAQKSPGAKLVSKWANGPQKGDKGCSLGPAVGHQ